MFDRWRAALEKKLLERWYQPSSSMDLLQPLSWIYGQVQQLHRRRALGKQWSARLPIVIIGNITVGGTGKTPFVIWLVKALCARGYRPGVASRGYGATSSSTPVLASDAMTARDLGDEPLLIAKVTGRPVCVHADRVLAVRWLQEQTDCDLIICDDGLQHYALARDLEVLLVDGARGFGNERLLPAGPLRESMNRLDTVDFIFAQELSAVTRLPQARPFVLQPIGLRDRQGIPIALTELRGKTVHALAAIGNFQRFARTLTGLGAQVIPHAYADHHQYRGSEFNLADHPIVITQKDAVKCDHLSSLNGLPIWILEVTVTMEQAHAEALFARIDEIVSSHAGQDR